MNTPSSTPLSVDSGTWRQEAAGKAHATVSRLSDGAHQVVDSLESAVQRAEPQGRRWVAATQTYVRSNPLKSLGWAVLAGMLVRQFVRR